MVGNLFAFVALVIILFEVISADNLNGYFFISPRYLKIGQNNQFQVQRFGCYESCDLIVQLCYKKDYKLNETCAQKQIFHMTEGKKDALLYMKVKSDIEHISSGRLQINGTMCGKKIAGTDEVQFFNPKKIICIIQTDKKLYKPGQTVKFRVLKLDKNLKPSYKKNDTTDVFVEDAKGTRLFEFRKMQVGKGITQGELLLSDEPVPGTWKMTMFCDKDTQFTTFDVKEYVLPKFDAKINCPSFVLRNADTIPLSVCAEYTYGKPVQGLLNLIISLEIYPWETTYSKTPVLEYSTRLDGCYKYIINVTDIDPKRDHGYKRIQVTASVIEEGTEVQANATQYMSRSYLPLNMDFNGNQGNNFKPGLPYNGKLKVTKPDNSPACGEPVEICATVSRQRLIDCWMATKQVKFCQNCTSDENGYIKYTILPQNADSISISLEARALKYKDGKDIGQPSAYAYLEPFYSPSGSFIQLQTIDHPIPCGKRTKVRVLFTAEDSCKFKMYYKILKPGGEVVKSGSQRVTFYEEDDVSENYENPEELINGSEIQISPKLPASSQCQSDSSAEDYPDDRISRSMPYIGEARIPIEVDASLSSSFNLLIYYVREDRETVADSQKIEVEKCFKNKVSFDFSTKIAQPGTPVSYRITSSPNSLCGIKVIDKSVTLLDSRDELTKDKIFNLLSNLDPPQYYGSNNLCYSNKPQPGLESRAHSKVKSTVSFRSSSYKDSYTAFTDTGYLVISNLKIFTGKCSNDEARGDRPIPITRPVARLHMASKAVARNAAINFDERADAGPSSTQSAVEVRNYFPETWLFNMVMTDRGGRVITNGTLPHTITEWEGNAVCINSEDGLGLSNTTSIKGFQAFFISITLPISVIRGEEFGFVVSIFNYADAAIPMTVICKELEGFEATSDLSDINICITPKESKSIKLKLKAITVGSHNITVEARTDFSSEPCGDSPVYDGYARDAITQTLEVEAEGFPNEEVESILFCPRDEENGIFYKNVRLNSPADAVPYSERAYVDICGNPMGPAIKNLNHLVSLPTGCGEQNLVKFVPNYLVYDYLTDIGQMTDIIKSKCIRNLETGYQNQLKFQHSDGSFSAFGNRDKEGSIFLTSFCTRSLYEAKRYIYIDDKIIQKAIEWIISKQQIDGCFPNVGKVIDSGIQGGVDNGTITAYVLSCLCSSNYKNQTVINKAISCLKRNPPVIPYSIFLYAYACALAKEKEFAQKLLHEVQPFANTTGDVEYYKNPNGTKSLDLETNAYCTLTKLELNNSKSEFLPNIRYLSTNLNPNGGFHSTQDTCVGLNALSQFAKLIKDPVTISCSIRGGLNELVEINEDNKLLVQRKKVPEMPSDLEIEAEGTGCALCQIYHRYNTFSPPKKNFFDIKIEVKCESTDCKRKLISFTVRYLLSGKKSGMAVAQIKLVTGSVMVMDKRNQMISDPHCKALRIDVENNQCIFYFSEIANNATHCSISVDQMGEVDNCQNGTIAVYDYYAPENSASTSYPCKAYSGDENPRPDPDNEEVIYED